MIVEICIFNKIYIDDFVYLTRKILKKTCNNMHFKKEKMYFTSEQHVEYRKWNQSRLCNTTETAKIVTEKNSEDS